MYNGFSVSKILDINCSFEVLLSSKFQPLLNAAPSTQGSQIKINSSQSYKKDVELNEAINPNHERDCFRSDPVIIKSIICFEKVIPNKFRMFLIIKDGESVWGFSYT